MGFNKHQDETIKFLTSGDLHNISDLSDDDSNADFGISDRVQQDIGENISGRSNDDDIQPLVTVIESNNKIPLDIKQKTPAMKQKPLQRTYRWRYRKVSRHIACKDVIPESVETLSRPLNYF